MNKSDSGYGILIFCFLLLLYFVILFSNKTLEEHFIDDLNLVEKEALSDDEANSLKKGDIYYVVKTTDKPILKIFEFEKEEDRQFLEDNDILFFTISEGDCHACAVRIFLYDKNIETKKNRMIKVKEGGSWGSWSGKKEIIKKDNEFYLVEKSGYTAQGVTECSTSMVRYVFGKGIVEVLNGNPSEKNCE